VVDPKTSKKEKGQSTTLFAVVLPAIVILLIVALDSIGTTNRLMEGLAVTDLAAHAGAQEIKVLPNGVIQPAASADQVAIAYFNRQAPRYVQLVSVWCGLVNKRPACIMISRVQDVGFLLGNQYITVRSVAYLVYGVTRGDQ